MRHKIYDRSTDQTGKFSGMSLIKFTNAPFFIIFVPIPTLILFFFFCVALQPMSTDVITLLERNDSRFAYSPYMNSSIGNRNEKSTKFLLILDLRCCSIEAYNSTNYKYARFSCSVTSKTLHLVGCVVKLPHIHGMAQTIPTYYIGTTGTC